jgi:hypothetical protein
VGRPIDGILCIRVKPEPLLCELDGLVPHAIDVLPVARVKRTQRIAIERDIVTVQNAKS